jgi:hypothetical protein
MDAQAQNGQPQVQVNVQQPQMANGGTPDAQNANGVGTTGFEAQETMQGDGVGQPTDAPNPADASTMGEGGEVSTGSDDLDWGMVFTFFKISNE